MSVSASTSIASPPPPSPGQSSSSTTASTPSISAVGNRHRSRPSFTISYSQPPPLRMSMSSTSNPGVPAGPDPKSSTGASSLPTKRPLPSSTTILNPDSAASLNLHHATNQPSKHFVAPAHPQSHHLHTLPPREKTTRTLILDHTAWRHGRTRFAQGRCELGMKVRFKSEEQPAEPSGFGSSRAGKRVGFYIGTPSGSGSVPRRVSNFGDPPEVELASSDDEGDDGEPRESDGEGVRALAYGRRSRQKGKDGKQEARANDRMEVDTEDELGSGSDSEVEPSARNPSTWTEDASLAPSLAARAIGIEKVLHAMLAQPPSSPPRSPSPPPYALHSSHANSQHYRPPPSTQQSTPPPSEDSVHVLPNGLRLRLALLALVNNLFERQPPQEELSPTTSDNSSAKLSAASTHTNVSNPSDPGKQTPGQGSPPPLPPPSLPLPNALPSGLITLAQISSQPFYVPPTLPSFQTLTLPSSSGGGSAMSTLSPMSGVGQEQSATASPSSVYPSSSGFGGTVAASDKGLTDGPQSTQARRPPPPLFTWTRPSGGPSSPSSLLPASPRSAAASGPPVHDKDHERLSTTSPTTQSFSRLHGPLAVTTRSIPSSWKGSTPKNLPQATKSASDSNLRLVKRARGRSRELYFAGCYASPSSATSTNSFRSNAPTYTYGTGTAPTPSPGYPLKKLKTLCPRHLREKCTICVSGVVARGGPSTRIGAGLLKKQGCLLAVGAVHGDDAARQSGSVLADLIPRFLRLSALVAMELGREARGEEPEANERQEDDKSDALSSASPISPTSKSDAHAQPTRAWFALLCGLLTRAVLEGYVARGWKGSEYAEVLMGVGLGIEDIGARRSSATLGGTNMVIQETPRVEEDVDEFEPDEMPRLVDASKVLFSGLVQDASVPGTKNKTTRSAEEEYVVEMEERMSEFLTISHAAPDLATYLTQLSEKYPAEPVERAALRFCEAVAKWRGKPELEMYKKLSVRSSTKSQSSTPAPLSINALLASTPTPVPHRPRIDKYFRVPPPRKLGSQPHRVLKRQRSVDEEEREPKKEKVEAVDFNLGKAKGQDEVMQEDAEWVGPYGV